jgi:hypothetical protein
MKLTSTKKNSKQALLIISIRAVAGLLKKKVYCRMFFDRLSAFPGKWRKLADQNGPAVCFVDGYHGGITFWDWIIKPEGGTWSLYNWPVVAEPILKQLSHINSLAAVFELDGHTYGWMAAKMPEAVALIRKALRTDRLEIVNGTYAQPLAGTFDDESYIRHFYYGLREIEQTLSCKVDTFASQEPAFFPQLPQILSSFGFKLAILRTHWAPFGTDPAHSLPLIRWRSADGSSILTVPRYPFMAYKKENVTDVNCGEVEMHYGKTNDDCFMAAHLELINFSGYNSGGLKQFQTAAQEAGLNLPLLTRLEDFNLLSGAPLKGAAALSVLQDVSFVTFRQYLDRLLRVEQSAIEEAAEIYYSTDQFSCYFPWGLQGGTPLTAAQEASRMLLEAERLAALTFLNGKDQDGQETLEPAWKKALQAQHHDLHLCGPWLSKKHQKSMGEVAVDLACKAREAACGSSERSLTFLSNLSREEEGKADPEHLELYVFNSLDYQRSDIVRLGTENGQVAGGSWKVTGTNNPIRAQWLPDGENGGSLALEITLNAFSGKRITLIRDQRDLNNSAVSYENLPEVNYVSRYYRACLSPEGELILADRDHSVLLRGAHISAWSEGSLYDSRREETSLNCLTSGPVADLYRVKGTVAAVPFTEVFSFYKNLPRVDIEITFDFGEGVFIGPQKDESKPGQAYYAQNEKKLNMNFHTRPHESIRAGGTFLVEKRKSEDFSANGFVALSAGEQAGWVLFRPGPSGYRWFGDQGHLQTVLAWGPREWLYASEDSVRVGGSGFTVLKGRKTYRCSLMYMDCKAEMLVRAAAGLANPLAASKCTGNGSNEKCSEASLLQVEPGSPVISALFTEGEKAYVRLCNYSDQRQNFSISGGKWLIRPVNMNLVPEGEAREIYALLPGKIQTVQIIIKRSEDHGLF